MNTDVAFVPLFGTFLTEDPQKESSALCKKQNQNTHGGCNHLHTSRFLLTSGTCFLTDLLPAPLFQGRAETSLCSTLLLFRYRPSSRGDGHKKARRLERHIGTVGLRLGNALRSLWALPWLLDVAPFPFHPTVAAC